jgi:glycerol-3-phosphate acyltransferase PlsX
MGSCYARVRLAIEHPRVGLMSIGEEAGKGSPLVKTANELLDATPDLRFVGNVEGRDVMGHEVDVVVTDGFTGNVALKISESLAEMLGAMNKEELTRDLRSKLGAALAMPAFERFRKRVDYTEMGGAPLLGIDGGAVICHGASPVKAIRNAIRVASEWASAGLNEHIKAALDAEGVSRGGREGGRE